MPPLRQRSHNPRQKQSPHLQASLFKQHRPKSQLPNMPMITVGASKDDIEPQTPVTFFERQLHSRVVRAGQKVADNLITSKTRDIESAARPASDHEGRPEDDRIRSITGTGFDYAEALREAFNRPGCTEFDDEDEFETDDIGNATVKNPQRRREKLAAGYRERINDEPTPDERRTEQSLLEGPNEAVRVSSV